MNFFSEIVSEIEEGKIVTRDQLEKRKKQLCKKHGVVKIPTNAEILSRADFETPLLLTKPTRSLSGVSVVAVMTKPQPCPGKCIYCPRGEAAQSYTGHEPAALRARQNEFDPHRQTAARLRQLSEAGHPTDKIEAIIMGGTFTAMPEEYQQEFVLGVFNALNGAESATIEEAHRTNETAKHRCIGLTFEIRPDYCGDEAVEKLLGLGATRVELGVQTVFDDVYEKVNRGHTVQDVVDATRRLKGAGLKVSYHLMPGLPGSSREKDLEMFRVVFEDERFKPDMIKIYPCLLAKREFYDSDEAHRLYESGEWKPLGNEGAASLIAEAKKYFPPWVRVMRIQRDIPAPYIEAGVTAGNLRELAHALNPKCQCIRCREIGRVDEDAEPSIVRREYGASGGKEVFISMETKKALFGFLRLRKAEKNFIRELHVYGPEAKIGKPGEVQHTGIGKALLAEAEKECSGKLSVTSGVGAREYYHRLGYSFEKPYMVKYL
ncbi:MAG: tRNA uridine(34) 5-carboxymethylaminomethyl modification radical SAM/GNAT enzyme Elp3 [Candidatus Diapherotrites archaeon]|nr:tRNA uridine(34) 5-carboxymethylaminomethyl modification radical SAM/GNAT enzyme Elp3 [Candidatus Diapherotrites archaeon]